MRQLWIFSRVNSACSSLVRCGKSVAGVGSGEQRRGERGQSGHRPLCARSPDRQRPDPAPAVGEAIGLPSFSDLPPGRFACRVVLFGVTPHPRPIGFVLHEPNAAFLSPHHPRSLIILTARSGRHALKHRLELLGYRYDKPTLDTIYTRFLDMADVRKEVNDKDLMELVR